MSRLTTLNRLIDPVNQETCKVYNLLQLSFTVKQPLSRLHSMLRDGMSKDGQKMSPMHVTLKAGVMRTVNILSLSRQKLDF